MQLEEAVKDGFDVRGYMYWTLIDNYEWNFAFELKFGLYSYDDDEAKTRHKRKGAEVCKPGPALTVPLLGLINTGSSATAFAYMQV